LLGAVVASNMMGGFGGAGGGVMDTQYNQPDFKPENTQGPTNKEQTAIPSNDVYCSNCSKKFASNLRFCPYCGDENCPCPHCGTDNDKDAKRCVSCGQSLVSQKLCPNCNTSIPAGVGFCSNCGRSVSDGKCTRCGAQIPPNAKFCSSCGQKSI